MKSTEAEKLTPRQQRIVAAIFLLLFVSFGGTTTYMYERAQYIGQRYVLSQQAKAQLRQRKATGNSNIHQIANKIRCGHSGQALINHSGENSPVSTPSWQITNGSCIATSSNPQGWAITKGGIVTVPIRAAAGEYSATYYEPGVATQQNPHPGSQFKELVFQVITLPVTSLSAWAVSQ